MWRSYRALVRRVIGWSLAEWNAMPWDEAMAEVVEALRIEGKIDG